MHSRNLQRVHKYIEAVSPLCTMALHSRCRYGSAWWGRPSLYAERCNCWRLGHRCWPTVGKCVTGPTTLSPGQLLASPRLPGKHGAWCMAALGVGNCCTVKGCGKRFCHFRLRFIHYVIRVERGEGVKTNVCTVRIRRVLILILFNKITYDSIHRFIKFAFQPLFSVLT